jgi:transcriptional regulator GlxA family with amidase domain
LFAGFSPNGTRRQIRRHRVAVLAFDGVVLADLATPCEAFGRARDANGNAAYEVRVCSIGPEVGSEHVALRVPWRLSSLHRADTVIVPGVDDLDRVIPEPLLRGIRRAVARRARVASVCSGAFVLAAAGVLDGRLVTTHWLAADELARRYPTVRVDPGVLYVDEGQVVTSAGASAAFDLCLHLVRRDLGAAAAADLARAAVMPLERAGGQAQFIVPETPTPDGSPIGILLTWLAQNLRRELSLPVIARRAGMSTRTLSRRFRRQVGTTPAAWIAGARVRGAQRLLETTDLSIEGVAEAVGITSSAVLRERFRRLVGTSPQSYRRSFRLA